MIEAVSEELTTRFLNPGAKLDFAKLRQFLNGAPILHHFYPECHI